MAHPHVHPPDVACAIAHGDVPVPADGRSLVAVFASPMARYLLHFARETGYRTALVEPDPVRYDDAVRAFADVHAGPAGIGPEADVVVTDHDRAELGTVLRDVLAGPARWVGVMGSPRHTAPHLAALAALGVAPEQVARVHRPIGLNIGSRSPAEIAIATLAGLIADRNGRPGGFAFDAAVHR
ncbi:MAG TPA: XdhC family protein [Mycobacteriales bacterium]|nr:XdhC family protein [Mycobacteriales bacterium]